MSDILEILKTRRSVRNYNDKMIPEEILNQIIEAGTYAPSGMGKQSPIILAVTNKELRGKLSRLNAAVMNSTNDPFYGAPVVLVVLADKNVGTYIYDGSTVMQNLMLAASELGVSSCWIHRAKEVFNTPEGKEILKSLNIPDHYEGIGNCILGYSDAPNPTPKPRKENYVYYVK